MGRETPQDLTDQQRSFIAHYLITLSAKKSAIAAGYNPKTAESQGCQLLKHPKVKKELRKIMARRAKRLDLKADNVLREIARIAFSDIRAVMSFGPDGVKITDSEKIHSDAAASIQSVEENCHTTQRTSSRKLKVKLHDKLKALDLAGRHLGLWKALEDDNEFRKMSLDQLIGLIEEAKKAK
jgi:phage terminase small subunit